MKEKRVMVCVTKQKTCERLIKYASRISGKDGSLFVVHVTPKEIPVSNSEVLQHLFNVSKKYYAQMSIIHSKDILSTILNYTKKHDINILVLGESLERQTENNMAKKIQENLNETVKPLIVPLAYKAWDKNIV